MILFVFTKVVEVQLKDTSMTIDSEYLSQKIDAV